MRLSLLCAALAATLLAACQPVRPDAPAGAAAASAPPAAVPADDNLNDVLWVQRSAEYRAAAAQTYRAATDHLDVALEQADWDALVPEERGNAARGLKPARRRLARHLSGTGIEIGALHNPMPVNHARATVRYVDFMSLEEQRRHYPELAGQALVAPDIVAPADDLPMLADESEDFVIANHLLGRL